MDNNTLKQTNAVLSATENSVHLPDCQMCQKTGLYHTENHLPCEDVILQRKTPELCFCGVADGQSCKKFSAEGARAVLEVVFDYVQQQGIAKLRSAPYPDEIQYALIRRIREKLLQLAQMHQTDVKEFSSTLVAFAYAPHTGDCITIHLGDGCILGRRKDGSVIYISTPENGMTRQYTWLTTSAQALLHLRLGFGSVQHYNRVVLMTDGATNLSCGKSLSMRGEKALKTGSISTILDLVRKNSHADDASCIVMDFA